MLIFAITLFPAPLWSQDKSELSLSINVSEDTPWGRAGKRFADAVRYRTGGRIRIKPYFDGQLFRGQQTTEFKLLQDGLAEFAIGSTINWSPQVKELNLFVLPFMFSRFSEVDAVQAGDPGRQLFRVIEQNGVVPLAWGENGFRSPDPPPGRSAWPQDPHCRRSASNRDISGAWHRTSQLELG